MFKNTVFAFARCLHELKYWLNFPYCWNAMSEDEAGPGGGSEGDDRPADAEVSWSLLLTLKKRVQTEKARFKNLMNGLIKRTIPSSVSPADNFDHERERQFKFGLGMSSGKTAGPTIDDLFTHT